MPKITRATQKIFAQNGTDQLAAFGSMKTGTPIYTDNIEDLQTSDYEDGWENAIVADEAPFLEEMNGVQYGFSKQLAYLFQEGIAEYDAETTYYKNSIVKGVNSDGVMTLWYSLTDNNIGNNPADDTTEINWKVLDFSGGGGSSSGTGYQLFDIIAKDHILTEDESLGLALLGTYVNKSVYPDFYNTCVSEKTAGTPTQTQLGDNTITTYNNANGHIFYDIADKAAVDAFYESLGIAWFYGVDMENERIFLPRNDWFFQSGATADVGKFVEAGLPNITGDYTGTKYRLVNTTGNQSTGALFQSSPSSSISTYTSGGAASTNGIGFDASRSNAIYGNSTTVQPNAVKTVIYMVVGNTQVEQAIINVTEVTTTENDTLPLFTAKYFDFAPNHVSWLKAGQQANSGGIYTTAYNTLVSELTLPTYGLKVIEVDNMQSDVDYSEYWKVDQDAMTFTTPTRISNAALTGRVKGNNKTVGWTNGINNAGSGILNNEGIMVIQQYGSDVSTSGAVSSGWASGTIIGITTDPSNSGIVAEEATSQLYFKVANAVQNLQLLDAGEITEALADKIGTTECKAYVTETYSNGSSWYRVWSDGWCEQGGRLSVTSNQTVTITFAKSFIDTNYTAFKNMGCNSTGAGAAREYSLWNFTRTSMQTQVNTNHYWTSWIAKGYIS